MKNIFLSVVVAATFALPAAAQDTQFTYSTELSMVDAFNSSGTPLEGWCTLLQQDRANWHRFNKRGEYDEGDPFFDSPERRAMMSGKCEVSSSVFQDPGVQIRNGNRVFDLTIQVYLSNGRVTRIRVADRF